MLGNEQKGIILQTHCGREIKNEIAMHPPPDHAVVKFERMVNQHPQWVVRKEPTGIYNCVGHVWASRRTAIYDDLDEVVLRIRDDDRHREIDLDREAPHAGDLAAYWQSLNPYKVFIHIGVIVEVKPRSRGLPPVIMILSKWDDSSGEVVHDINDMPKSWRSAFTNVRFVLWTDRPCLKPAKIIR